MVTEADEYNGYHIPKGTIVIGNSWLVHCCLSVWSSTQVSCRSILHDPETYKDPLAYNPDRFLKDGEIDPTVRDPTVAAFGFGRRICPGRFLAENSLFISYVIFWLSTISDLVWMMMEENLILRLKWRVDCSRKFCLSSQHIPAHSRNRYPVPFSCRIIPRSKKAENLVSGSSLIN